MVRFKNRYLVVEVTWKDGRLDESLSEWATASLPESKIYALWHLNK